ncbi:MAG TPA: winged helix-turn-helix domain-containing protein [Thermoguttaceae bacterium]|nr:winged helix-turn-helix domain-containing protein [Thermoguttaceae bacterium]
MKKDDVKIGQTYMAKLSKNVVPVRIDAENAKGGWDAKSLATGRTVRIESAGQLQRECTQADLAGSAKATAKKPKRKATTSPTAATDAKTAAKATKEAKPEPAATRAKQGDDAKPKKAKAKMSGLDAAAKVLLEAKKPMGTKQIVEVAFAKKYWQSGGKTPAATLYAAIIREIAIKKKDSRFRKAGRGKFSINEAK